MQVVEVQLRDGNTGETPVIFYITAGNQLVPAEVVMVVMENAMISDVGGYRVSTLIG